ncbi:histidine kinase [Cellulophaga sp. HaHaR_3_176]|uniref:sensor histidine kinase n=1 Tax=Cellulophaga sp. HaHaR_3_176 TaxID=1942464 RepID=UPI001C1F942F|nr:histidine kinase [Cellulophaga sp. HaHaR_3_176]QWX82967.1 histidine kinase [Cellulophaga sp. HaHaR_3_176]
MQKIISKNLFWVLQFIGWGFLSMFIGYVGGTDDSLVEVLIIELAIMFIGILSTSALRWVLNKIAPLEKFNIYSALKVLAAIAIVVSIIPMLSYYFGYFTASIVRYFIGDIDAFKNSSPSKSGYGKYVFYFILIGGWTVFFYIIKLLKKSLKLRIDRLQLKDQVKQAQLNTLKGHINPQFIFTSLNNIKGLMLEDVTKSRAMLTTLSEMLRYSLTKNNINSVKLEDDLEIAENYILILNIEGKNRFTVTYDIAKETEQLNIPPMLLTNLIELATRFGVLNLKQDGTIKLQTELRENGLKISIIHNGKAEISKPRQVLETTIKQRLKLLFGVNEFVYMSNFEIDKNTIWVLLPLNSLKTEVE